MKGMKAIREILRAIKKAETFEELNKIEIMIVQAFETEKITYEDHEILLDMIVKVSCGKLWRPNVPIITE